MDRRVDEEAAAALQVGGRRWCWVTGGANDEFNLAQVTRKERAAGLAIRWIEPALEADLELD